MTLNINVHKSAHKSNVSALFYILGQILLIYLTSTCFFYFFENVTKLNLIFYLLAISFIGTRMRALGNILHECSHFSYAPNKKGNIFFGNFISILDLSSFSKYRKNHVFHHRHLGVLGKDNDYMEYLKFVKAFKDKKIFDNFFTVFALVVFNPINWILCLANSFSVFEKNKAVVMVKILYISIVVSLCVFVNPSKFFLFLIIPYFTVYQVMKISSDFLDHHKIYFDKEYFLKTRNHLFKNKLLNLIFFPRNDSYHLVHHMYPSAPVTDLNKIHKYLLANNIRYASRKHYLF